MNGDLPRQVSTHRGGIADHHKKTAFPCEEKRGYKINYAAIIMKVLERRIRRHQRK
jgi:hypothetical protein